MADISEITSHLPFSNQNLQCEIDFSPRPLIIVLAERNSLHNPSMKNSITNSNSPPPPPPPPPPHTHTEKKGLPPFPSRKPFCERTRRKLGGEGIIDWFSERLFYRENGAEASARIKIFPFPCALRFRLGLIEAWLAPTSVKCGGNLTFDTLAKSSLALRYACVASENQA